MGSCGLLDTRCIDRARARGVRFALRACAVAIRAGAPAVAVASMTARRVAIELMDAVGVVRYTGAATKTSGIFAAVTGTVIVSVIAFNRTLVDERVGLAPITAILAGSDSHGRLLYRRRWHFIAPMYARKHSDGF